MKTPSGNPVTTEKPDTTPPRPGARTTLEAACTDRSHPGASVASASLSTDITSVGGRPCAVVQDRGESYFVDAATGEILHATRKLPRRRVVRVVHVDVGVDTRWPSEARNAEELLEAATPFDSWEDKHYVSRGKFLDLLDHNASPSAVRVLRYIAEKLAGRNYWYGTVGDLEDALAIPKRSLERALQELTAMNALKRKSNGKAWPIRFSIHPWYAWKGDLLGRDAAYSEWIGFKPASFGG